MRHSPEMGLSGQSNCNSFSGTFFLCFPRLPQTPVSHRHRGLRHVPVHVIFPGRTTINGLRHLSTLLDVRLTPAQASCGTATTTRSRCSSPTHPIPPVCPQANYVRRLAAHPPPAQVHRAWRVGHFLPRLSSSFLAHRHRRIRARQLGMVSLVSDVSQEPFHDRSMWLGRQRRWPLFWAWSHS